MLLLPVFAFEAFSIAIRAGIARIMVEIAADPAFICRLPFAALQDVCAILSGLVVACDYKEGQKLIVDKEFKARVVCPSSCSARFARLDGPRMSWFRGFAIDRRLFVRRDPQFHVCMRHAPAGQRRIFPVHL